MPNSKQKKFFSISSKYTLKAPKTMSTKFLAPMNMTTLALFLYKISPRAFKRLGLMKPETHMDSILKAGRVQEDSDRVDIVVFVGEIMAEIERRVKKKSRVSQQLIAKLFALLQLKKLSVFEFFCVMDVNRSSKLSKLELKTGIQQLGFPLNS